MVFRAGGLLLQRSVFSEGKNRLHTTSHVKTHLYLLYHTAVVIIYAPINFFTGPQFCFFVKQHLIHNPKSLLFTTIWVVGHVSDLRLNVYKVSLHTVKGCLYGCDSCSEPRRDRYNGRSALAKSFRILWILTFLVFSHSQKTLFLRLNISSIIRHPRYNHNNLGGRSCK